MAGGQSAAGEIVHYRSIKGASEMASIDEMWERIQSKLGGMTVSMAGKSPHASGGVYDDLSLDWWTSGFWPGMLWIMYDLTGEESYREKAWDWDERIATLFLRENNFHHDVGFQFLPTAVIKYQLTGDPMARGRGLLAATFLAGRFNPAGGFIRAWNQEERAGWVIIDTLMNLSLLFWAGREFKDPRFRHIAMAHADTVLRHFQRQDGSVNHITRFDPESGAVIEALAGQGYAPDSAWSRGQAWAIYGFTNAFKYTGAVRYLEGARRVAQFFLTSLPEDQVPYWDFRLPSIQGEPRDTSAAACAASAFLDLATLLPEDESRIYRKAAETILTVLFERYSSLNEPGYEGLLKEATGNRNTGMAVNVSLIYGDYFFLEAIAKLRGWQHRIF
jgi:unsaturated chondroitin disaccharide hydrolase